MKRYSYPDFKKKKKSLILMWDYSRLFSSAKGCILKLL